MKKVIISLALCLTLSACIPESKELSRTDFGEITDIQVLPTSFSKCRKTQIKTTKGFAIVVGYHSCIKGTKTQIIEYSDGEKYLKLENSKESWEIF